MRVLCKDIDSVRVCWDGSVLPLTFSLSETSDSKRAFCKEAIEFLNTSNFGDGVLGKIFVLL